MENPVPRKDARDRLHRRALSQASTASSTMHSPKTVKSTSTSTSSHPRAITPSNPLHTHRYHHSQCDRETAGIRQPGRLSRESSSESKQLMTPASSLLQERLQQERKAESERLASKWGTDLSSSTGDIRDSDISNSPNTRYGHVAERRPGSSHNDDSSQTSMGAKQIEKAVSTLHKQNFDLKLELFHRREKQSALEARVEELSAERAELTEIQENLLGELVKRDKAIEEAVNMIVKLEARLEELDQEKEMPRRFEADRSNRHSWSNVSDSLRTETPKPDDHGALPSAELKTLERMPSFLSDQSAHTQTLRSIVLQNRSSTMHMRKVSEVSASSADVSEVNRVASPSFSMLSESSFVSIYGPKQGQDGINLPPLSDVSGIDGTFGNRPPMPTKRTMSNSLPNQKTATSGGTLNMTPRAARGISSQIISVNSVLHGESQFYKIGSSGEKTSLVDNTSKSLASGRGKVVVTPNSQFVGSPPRARSRQERRESLQTVLTNYPTYKELANPHPLPPTPDTVSSLVLRKHTDPSSSQDSLSRSDDPHNTRFVAASLPHGSEYLRSLGAREVRPGMNAQPTELSAPPRNRSQLPTTGFIRIEKDPLLSDLGHLARSAANTTKFTRPRSDSFVSDSDSDGGADARSDSESCDYWMRESYKPDKGNAHPNARVERQRPSPDLFSFPVGSEGWEPDAMFGTLKGNGFLGSPAPALKRDPVDEMASSLQAAQPDLIEPTANCPQGPSRRSSLSAQAASRFLLSTLTGKHGRSSSRDDSVMRGDARGRSNSVDGFGHVAMSGNREDGGQPTKRSQYPPISGLQSRGRNLGFNSLFRRSGSESYSTPSSATESNFPPSVSQQAPPIPPAHLRYLKRPSGRNSVPPPATTPWTTRPVQMVEDELASATPPPIMRNRPTPLQTDLISSDAMLVASETSRSTEAGADPVTPSTGVRSTTPVAPHSGGGVRKWLGFGRKTASMNRAG
ncbi:hypothetical protein F5Y09DRAFT_347575 [Xylaria sp. FL1042]|nr:hypothetical protein F5Y09DRAFT_347575 [Xylaria sp. FL1042]